LAAVDIGTIRPVRVVDADIGKAAEDLIVGQPVVIDPAADEDPRYPCTYEAATAEALIHGVCLKPAVAGGPVEVCLIGEFDGYVDLTGGDPLSVAAGVIDDTAPAAGLQIQLYASSSTRIRVRI
jgi:hypothetical protein